jgi:cell division protein FtsQ
MPALMAPPGGTLRRPGKRLSGPSARWLRRGFKAGIVVAACVIAGLAWRSGRLETTAERAASRGVMLLAECGFRVEEVDVSGRIHTDPKALLDVAGLSRGNPILGFNPEEIRRRIETLPWVESAAVERRLPHTVAITVMERTPIALWQHNAHISLIDAEGADLGPAALESAPELPMVVGGDAPAHAAALLGLLAAEPEIAKRVRSSSWVGSRRWDLKLDQGADILLPETGVSEALRQLADAEASSRLLERDVVAVDLRLPGKMIVRLAHEPAAVKPAKPPQGI